MSLILCIETTSRNCSVALVDNGIQVDIIELEEEGYTHAENLSLFVEELLRINGKDYVNLDAIAISKGPGSYTGLRIGTATSKGLCFALDIPLISINTLDMMSEAMKGRVHEVNYYCPMIDARRMEVYTALYDKKLDLVEEPHAKILNQDSFKSYMDDGTVVFAGNGSGKFREIINNNHAIFLDQFKLSASMMADIAQRNYRENKFEDLAYFEPFYLKKFHATVPKDKLRSF